MSLSPCWRQLHRTQRLLKTAAPFPYWRGPRAWPGIGSNRVRSSAVTTANLRLVNFKREWRSCGNSSKETPTAAPGRQPAPAPAESRGAIPLHADDVRGRVLHRTPSHLRAAGEPEELMEPLPTAPGGRKGKREGPNMNAGFGSWLLDMSLGSSATGEMLGIAGGISSCWPRRLLAQRRSMQ